MANVKLLSDDGDRIEVVTMFVGHPSRWLASIERLALSEVAVKPIVVASDTKPSNLDAAALFLSQKFPDYTVIGHKYAHGIAHALNTGLALTRGRHVGILEDGILVKPQTFPNLRRVLQRKSKYAWVGARQIGNPLNFFTAMCSLLDVGTIENACRIPRARLFDERFVCGYDDADLVMTLRSFDFEPHGVETYVEHPLSQTTTRELFPNMDGDWSPYLRKLFLNKWDNALRSQGKLDFDWGAVPVEQVEVTA